MFKRQNNTLFRVHVKNVARIGRRFQNRILQFVIILTIAAFFLFAYLASSKQVPNFDLNITIALQSLEFPPIAWMMNVVSWIGYIPQSLIIMAFVAIILYGFRFRLEATISLTSSLLIQVLNLLVKIIIHRPRPSTDLVHVFNMLSDYSFPSGHVMFYTVFFGFNWFLVFTLMTHSWKRRLLLLILGGMVLLIGVSRVYLGVHWTSDVIGAYLLSGIVLIGIIKFYKVNKKRLK